MRSLAPEGFAARFSLAWVASAAFMFANVSPLVVSGMIDSLGFSAQEASTAFSADMFGIAIGVFAGVGLINRLPWRPASAALLVGMLACDLVSIWMTDANALTALRFAHGIMGGACVAIVFAVIARVANPERTFAVHLVIQLGLGGVAVATLGSLMATLGLTPTWLALVGFSAVAIGMVFALGEYRVATVAVHLVAKRGFAILPAALVVAAVLLFQISEMAIFAFVLEIGRFHELDAQLVGLSVAAGLWFAIPCGLFVVWWSLRSGRMRPLVASILLTAVGMHLYSFASGPAFLAASLVFSGSFTIALPYLLGLAAELDVSGRLVSFVASASTLGLASGPMLAAAVIGDAGDYPLMITAAVSGMLVAMFASIYPARVLDAASLRPLPVATA